MFAENHLAIYFHIIDPALAGNEFGLDLQSAFQFCGQTGRTRQIVSNLTVFDGDLHGAVC